MRYMAFILLSLLLNVTVQAKETALDRYLAKEDGYFQWEWVQTHSSDLEDTHELKITSQKWLNEELVSRSVWQHQVFITVPKSLNLVKSATDSAILYIGGGANHKTYGPDEMLTTAAKVVNKILVEIKQVPNEKMVIYPAGDKELNEDDIVSASFEQYLNTGNEEWPLYLPMTKSVHKGMDAASAYLKTLGFDIDAYVAVGASKRGWTTWLAGATDDRIVGLVPVIIDVLDIDNSMEKQWEAIGDYYPILATYTDKDLPCRFQTPEGQALLEIVDPVHYQDRLSGKPKYVLNGAGDPFFLNTNSTHYWQHVSEPKSLRYVPNAGHDLPTEAITGAFVYAAKIATRYNLGMSELNHAPDIFWERNGNTLTVYSSRLPLAVHFNQAVNTQRDFRQEVVGEEAWTKDYVLGFDIEWMDRDNNGWKEAYFSFSRELSSEEGQFSANMFSLNFGLNTYSTSIYMTPDVFPFKGQHCQ